MATISVPDATITIPAAYLEDARLAILAEISDSGDALRDLGPEDRPGSVRILSRDMRLLDQLLDATGDTTVEAVQDNTSSPVVDMLEMMVQQLSGRLERECVYRPLPMGAILPLVERLQWAAGEAVRIRPDLLVA